jgi:hypothetical protein
VPDVAGVSQVDAVLTALQTVFATAVGASVPVYDGLPATDSADTAFVLVGHDGDVGSNNPAATVEQTRTERNITGVYTESGDVTCSVICQTGDDDFPGLRTNSRTLMAAVEAAVRADPSLGGVAVRAQITDLSLWQFRNLKGSGVRRVFTVHYDANQ